MTLMSNKITLLMKCFALICLLAVGCAPRREEVEGGAIIKAAGQMPTSLNPILAVDEASRDINNLVYNGLVKYDKDLNLVGDLARSWDISEGGLKITFHLRENVRWHDGEEFTAEDVLYTYEKLVDPKIRTPYSSPFEMVEDIYAPDKYTVVVEYSRSFSPVLESWGMGIIPRHIYKGTNINENPRNRDPVGTGPYVFRDWRTDDRILLEANPDYFEGRPEIGRFIYKIIPDISLQFTKLKQGEIDWMSPTPEQWVQETEKEEFKQQFHRFKYPTFSFTYMAYNLNNEIFADRRVREAISYAVNKKDIIDAALSGLGTVATGPYPPVSWAYEEDIEDRGHDINKALELLGQAGWSRNPDSGMIEKDGRQFSFTVMIREDVTEHYLSAEIIQQQLKEIGMDVRVRIQEGYSFFPQYVSPRQFDAIILGWKSSVDPDQYHHWHSSQTGEDEFNVTGYENEEVDRLLERGRRVFDIQDRREIYRQVQGYLNSDKPSLFLYYSKGLIVIDSRFQNIEKGKGGITHNFIDWYVPQELRKH